ncbi:MAG: hypothetical protein ICV78_10975 [Tolypothrix sp. Co-bin9]|nr:hypothetical protein [Tolypothrix sp. Co-bin9]
MTTFSTAFKPALNKSGFARAEYIGYEVKEGTSTTTNKDGEIIERPWSFLNICFEVRGTARGSAQKMSVTCGFTYADDNALGITLKALGYEPPAVEMILDEDGFEVEAVAEDEEGFEQSEEVDFGIEEFLETIKGKVFLAKVYRGSEGKQKGYWVLDHKSLSPLQK